MPEDLIELLRRASLVETPKSEHEAQRRSFAFGNARIENADITRETIDAAAERIAAGKA